MTTSKSPVRVLKTQADKIAARLKSIERGDNLDINDPGRKITASLASGVVTFGIFMDDKLIKIEMPWKIIKESDEASISEWILSYMQGLKSN